VLVRYRVLYLSHNAQAPHTPQDYWDARQFTIAVKRAHINGYFHFPDGIILRRIDHTNVLEARRRFGAWLLQIIQANTDGNVVLVPVPSTDAVQGQQGPSRSIEMLDGAFSAQPHHAEVHDLLRFTEPIEKASKGGPRHEDLLYPLLTMIGPAPSSPIILVDDIATTGGHLKAAKRRLEDGGATVLSWAIVCGRTVWDISDPDPWVNGCGGHYEV
jgi:predicted amidophosphoribosyltransferase